jgi:hypothetical protein
MLTCWFNFNTQITAFSYKYAIFTPNFPVKQPLTTCTTTSSLQYVLLHCHCSFLCFHHIHPSCCHHKPNGDHHGYCYCCEPPLVVLMSMVWAVKSLLLLYSQNSQISSCLILHSFEKNVQFDERNIFVKGLVKTMKADRVIKRGCFGIGGCPYMVCMVYHYWYPMLEY